MSIVHSRTAVSSDEHAFAGSPYRTPAPHVDVEPDDESEQGIIDETWSALFVLWLASIARVVGGLHRKEVVGAELTLALIVVVVPSWLLCKHLRARHVRRCARIAKRR